MPPLPTDTTVLACLQAAVALSESSRKTYAALLRSLRLRYALSLASPAAIADVIASAGEATGRIAADATTPPRTKQALVKAVLAVYKHSTCLSHPALVAALPAWEAVHKQVSGAITAESRLSELSTREEEAWVPLSAWLAKLDEVARADPGSPDHLLLAMYCLWPPPRGGDLGLVRLVACADDPLLPRDRGLLVWRDLPGACELLLVRHKTAKHYGTLRRQLPPDLRAVLAASLAARPRQYLFTQTDCNEPFGSDTAFTCWANRRLKELFGRPATCNTARHAFISAVDAGRMSVAQLEDLAAWMGHSVRQQSGYRRLLSPAAPMVAPDGTLNIPMRHDTVQDAAQPGGTGDDPAQLLFPLLAHEVQRRGVDAVRRDMDSGVCSVLWIARTLAFVSVFLDMVSGARGGYADREAHECARAAYKECLQPYHKMILTAVVSAALRAVGTREGLRRNFGYLTLAEAYAHVATCSASMHRTQQALQQWLAASGLDFPDRVGFI